MKFVTCVFRTGVVSREVLLRSASQACFLPGVMVCSPCGGQVQFRQIGPGMVQQLQSACSSCRGEGKVINERDKCKACGAKKVGIKAPMVTPAGRGRV